MREQKLIAEAAALSARVLSGRTLCPREEQRQEDILMKKQTLCDIPADNLEQEYETSLEKGLTAGEVNRRLSENRFEYLTKEKKRSWIRSAEQECLDPLFFFLLFLCTFYFLTEEKGWLAALPLPVIVLLLKVGQAKRNNMFLQKRKELFLPKIQVLRDGVYRYIDVREIVIGDILRLKKGKRVPTAVRSLINPGVVYEKGDVFPEESGKAVAMGSAGSTALQKRGILSRILSESALFPLRAQEMLYRRGVIAMETSCLPGKGKKRAVIIDTEYFPSSLKPHALRELTKLLQREAVPLIFFTDKKREEAFDILKRLGLAEQERDVIDEKQFACYLDSDYRRQLKTIRAYAGLNKQEKSRVLDGWCKECDWLYVLPDRNWQRPEKDFSDQKNLTQRSNAENVPDIVETERKKEKGRILWLGLLDESSLDRDFYFKKHWSDGLLRLFQCESRWNTFENITEMVQKRTLIMLCIFNGIMLFAGCSGAGVPVFYWMFLVSYVICGGLALWRELWWMWMHIYA